MVEEVGEENIYNEPVVEPKYTKLPNSLLGPLKEVLKHERRKGNKVVSDNELNKFFE